MIILTQHNVARPRQGVAGSLAKLVMEKNKSTTNETRKQTTKQLQRPFTMFDSTPTVHKVSVMAAETTHGASFT